MKESGEAQRSKIRNRKEMYDPILICVFSEANSEFIVVICGDLVVSPMKIRKCCLQKNSGIMLVIHCSSVWLLELVQTSMHMKCATERQDSINCMIN